MTNEPPAPPPTRSRRLWLFGGVAAAAAGFGAVVALKRHTVQDNGLSPPDREFLYAQILNTPGGEPFALSELRGRALVLNFWATWCPPCVEEMPELAALHTEIAGRNATVLGIAIDSPSNVRQFLTKTPVNYPILLGGMGGSDLYRRLGNTADALPFTLVLNARGELVERRLGRIRFDELRPKVLAALA